MLAKLVAPRDEMIPSAVTGPGVSSPTARTAVSGTPVTSRMTSSDRASASTALSGPSSTQLGDSAISSTRNWSLESSKVALIVVPPQSSPATTQPSGPMTASLPSAVASTLAASGRTHEFVNHGVKGADPDGQVPFPVLQVRGRSGHVRGEPLPVRERHHEIG